MTIISNLYSKLFMTTKLHVKFQNSLLSNCQVNLEYA